MFDARDAAQRLVLNAARFSGLPALSAPFLGGVGAILMLHRVTAEPAKPLGLNRALSITPSFLDTLLGDLTRHGYHLVTMDKAVDRIRARSGEGRFVTITADDGYRDNLTEALPVLERHAAPITVYVAPGLVEGETEPWWDVVEDVVTSTDSVDFHHNGAISTLPCSTPDEKTRAFRRIHHFVARELPEEERTAFVRALARDAALDAAAFRPTLMNWDGIRQFAAHPLATIGAHTVSHPNLRRLQREAALREIQESGRAIERNTGIRPRHFAYPYGHALAAAAREAALAREAGYVTAVTTRHGLIQPDHANHLHALPRISVDGRYQQLGYIRTMLSGVTTPLANRGKRLVTV